MLIFKYPLNNSHSLSGVCGCGRDGSRSSVCNVDGHVSNGCPGSRNSWRPTMARKWWTEAQVLEEEKGEKVAGPQRRWGDDSQNCGGSSCCDVCVVQMPIIFICLLPQRAFDESGALTVSTLLGVISQFTLVYDEKTGSINLSRTWQKETENVKKVNALVVGEKRIIVGGLKADGSGVFEIWKR